MSEALYIFESGSYSDHSRSEVVIGPDGADVAALYGEFVVACRALGCEYAHEAADHLDALLGRPFVDVLPAGGDYDRNDEFAAWLVARRGWRVQPTKTLCMDDIMDNAWREES